MAPPRETISAESSQSTYDDLMQRTDAPEGSSWGLFPEHPERGMANFAGTAEVLRGVAHVQRGMVFNLDYPLDVFDPQIAPARSSPRHEVFGRHEAHRDDVLRDFYPQCSSQIDGLRHFGTATEGFYNGVPGHRIIAGTPDLGIQRIAEHPIVGRGLVVDVDKFMRDAGQPIDHRDGPALDSSLIDEVLDAQQSEARDGDILLVHTGWARWYLGLEQNDRAAVNKQGRFTGFAQSREFLKWMWEHRIALLASDLIGIEVFPGVESNPFRESDPLDNGMMHAQLLARLGLMLGEIWFLTDLAEDSSETGEYYCMITVKPLNLRGGVGSPPNAIAIR